MRWICHIGVALLNVGWIAFFLEPDPLSVLVQRRSSSDEEMEEFCLRPPADKNWTSTLNSGWTTAEVSQVSDVSTLATPQEKRLTSSKVTPTLKPEVPLKPRVDLNPNPHPDCDKGPDDCCYTFCPGIVNTNSISSYYWTSYCCRKTGVILVTNEKRNICVDPNLPWVKEIMTALNRKDF